MAAKAKRNEGKLYTLTGISNTIDISMPTLQRYKKAYQSRIPSVGKGRKQRYPQEALAVFEAIKQENIAKRGRPRKAVKSGAAKKATAKKAGNGRRTASGRKAKARARKVPSKKSAASRGAATTGLLTLTEISKRTKISYPTLVRYVKLHPEKLKHEGEGRKRRFYPEAVEAFKAIRASSTRGPRKGSRRKTSSGPLSAGKSDQALAARIRKLETRIKQMEKRLSRPVKFSLPG